ncbi:MAG: protein kinase [Bryobacterales bacterium]|nr:protein kinase [Bryobacterales bacterium]
MRAVLLILVCLGGLAAQQPYAPPYAGFDILQDKQGYVWIAGHPGLRRFDAHQVWSFSTADGLPGDDVSSLAETEDGTLWLGTPQVLARYRDGRFTKVLDGMAMFVAPLPDGRLWVSGPRTHLGKRRPDGEWEFQRAAALDGASVMVLRGDRIWFLREDRICWVPVGAVTGRAPLETECDGSVRVSAIGVDDAGRLLVREDRRLRFYDPERKRLSEPQAESSKLIYGGRFFSDRLGRLWPPSNGQMIGWYSGRLNSVAVGSIVGTYLLDDDGTMWVQGQRIAYFDEWLEPADASLPLITSIARDESGVLWASSAEAVLRRAPGATRWMPVSFGAAMQGRVVGPFLTLRAAPGGGVHVTSRGTAMVRLDGQGRLVSAVDGPDLNSLHLAVTSSGELWLTGKAGFYRGRYSGNRYAFTAVPLPGTQERVRAVQALPNGDIAVGWANGVAIVREGKVIFHRNQSSGLLEDRLQCLAANEDELWVGYDNERAFSLIRYREPNAPIRHFTLKQGYRAAGTLFLHIDRRGWLWRGGTDGIFVSDRQALEPDDWFRLAEHEGRPFPGGTTQNSVFEDDDGSLFFGLGNGVMRYHPPTDLLQRLKRPSKVAITAVGWDSQTPQIAGRAARDLPEGGHTFHVRFSALHYTNPAENQYRYRLWPLEKEWKNGTTPMQTYPNLAAGDYRFEVLAKAENRAWSAVPAQFAFTLVAPFYSQAAFQVPACGIGLGIALLLARRAMRRRSRRQRARQVRELFQQAIDLTPAARRPFVESKAQHAEVAREVLGMLEHIQDPVETRLLPIGEVFEERYEIERWIGSGGFSHVYRARDRKLGGRPVAIKIHHSVYAAQPEFLSQLKKEVSILSGLRHPNIVAVQDTGIGPGGQLFLAMEYVEGQSLRQVLQKGPLDGAAASAYLTQLASALDSAHRAGIIHGDIKPGNLLIGSDGRLVVIDYGFATREGAVTQQLPAGTPDYLSPEQRAGKVAAGSDVYAMALVAFEMLTAQVAMRVLRAGGTLREHVPEPVAQVLELALAEDPAARPTARELAERFVGSLR